MELYTDGSCLGNPGSGGWAAHIEGLFTLSGGVPRTTNNRMEMTAVVHGLEKALECEQKCVKVFTDSTYVKNGITQWVTSWQLHNWKTSTGEPVKNKDLWERIIELERQFERVEWNWVKAHAGNPMNEKVDQLARQEAEKKSK
jgi:ribonuclease HI